jgi:hypothetical protein
MHHPDPCPASTRQKLTAAEVESRHGMWHNPDTVHQQGTGKYRTMESIFYSCFNLLQHRCRQQEQPADRNPNRFLHIVE